MQKSSTSQLGLKFSNKHNAHRPNSKNTAVINASTAVSNALITGDKALYAEGTGIIDKSLDVKTYVKSMFGSSSPQYTQVTALKFKCNQLI